MNLSPSTLYYSLTNINDVDEQYIQTTTTTTTTKTLSKLDVGYASEEDELEKHQLQPIYRMKPSRSDSHIDRKSNPIFSSLTHSLPILERNNSDWWWRYSITSAYETCSNPDMDLSIERAKTVNTKPKTVKRPTLPSYSYDASAEYTDPEQSDNDVDVLSSDSPSSSLAHQYPTSDSLVYNRYTTGTTATTTTTGYSTDVELETSTTLPSEAEDHLYSSLGERTSTCLQMSADVRDDFLFSTSRVNEVKHLLPERRAIE